MAFTNKWIGPAKQGQGYKPRISTGKPGSDTAPDATVVSSVLTFADGTRSVAGPYRQNFWLPSNWPSNGWRPVRTDRNNAGGNYATWGDYFDEETASNLDALLAKGYVLFYLDSSLGNLGASSGNPWPPGWYAHPAKGVWPEDMANFTWGMSMLNGTATAVAQGQSPPLPQQSGGAVFVQPQPTVIVTPPPSRLPELLKIGAAVLVIGGIVWLVEA